MKALDYCIVKSYSSLFAYSKIADEGHYTQVFTIDIILCNW